MADGVTYTEDYGDFSSSNSDRTLTHDMLETAGGDNKNTTALCKNGASEQFLSIAFKLVRSIKDPLLNPEVNMGGMYK